LMHEPASVTVGEGDVERFEKVMLGESGTPCWIVVSSFLRWFVKYSTELFELVVTEFGRTSGARFVVERGVEAALFEAFQPIVGGLAVPSVLVFDCFWRESSSILACSGKALDRLRIGLVRELLADSFF